MKLFRSIIILLVVINSAYAGAANILVIESYHKEYKWDQGYIRALKESLGSEHQLTFFEMDTKRLPKEYHLERADLAWKKYQELQPDLVILGDDFALKYLGPKLKQTQTPTVYLGINNNPRNYAIDGAKNITGVLERPLVKRSVVSTKRILPNLKRVVILLDSGITSSIALETILNNQSVAKISNILVEVKLIEQFSLWQSEVVSAKENGYDAIFIGLYHTIRDDEEQHVLPDTVINWTNKNSPVPIFGFWTFAVGKNKAIGGIVLDAYQQGLEAANIVQDIFSGTPVHTILPRKAEEGRYVFSQYEVARFGLDIPKSVNQFVHWID